MTTDSLWPKDAETVTHWVRTMLRQDAAELEIRGLEEVRISVDLAGDHLENLTVDASSVQLQIRTQESPPAQTPGDSPRPDPVVVHSHPGTTRIFRLVARDLLVNQVPMNIDMQLHDTPIMWQVYAEPVDASRPESAYGIEVDENGTGMRGSITASIHTADLAPLLQSVLGPVLEAEGIALQRVSVDVRQDGRTGLRISGSGALRWRFLSASARGTARIDFSRDGVVTVHALKVGSRNPLVALALLAARRQVRAQVGTRIDLNDSLAEDGLVPRISDLEVSANKELRVSARLS